MSPASRRLHQFHVLDFSDLPRSFLLLKLDIKFPDGASHSQRHRAGVEGSVVVPENRHVSRDLDVPGGPLFGMEIGQEMDDPLRRRYLAQILYQCGAGRDRPAMWPK